MTTSRSFTPTGRGLTSALGEGAVGGAGFRSLMSTFPSGVAVVTTVDRHGSPCGLTCSAVCSVSLAPPLLLVCIANESHTLETIRDRAMFAVNLLHSCGREAAEVFSSRIPDRFRHVRWQPTARWALPSLSAHAHAVAECRVSESRTAGDHTIIVGEVVEITTMAAAPVPLLYGLRRYVEWPSPRSQAPRLGDGC